MREIENYDRFSQQADENMALQGDVWRNLA
jgi:hypothetical protein